MKAVAVFPGKRQVRVIDAPEPELQAPTQVKVRTHEVGVCGTDKDIVSFTYGTPPPGLDYLILGHECLGEVVEVGPAVQGLQKGDWVVPRVRRPCPHALCPACRGGHPDFCITGDFTERGIKEAPGFCSEHFVEDVAYLHRVATELHDVAVLTEPLTIAEKALRQLDLIQERLPWRPVPGRAVVLGAGPVGQLGVLTLLRRGFATTVYSHSRKPNVKAEAAEAVGAPYLSTQDISPEELVRRAGAPDVIYEAAGTAKAAFEALKSLSPNGVFIFTGVPSKSEQMSLGGDDFLKQLVLNNQVLLGTVNAAASDFDAALEDLARFRARWPGGLERLITARHPPESFFDVVTGKAGGGIKHVITFT
ncbi:glucose 1-dehydrogenase [Myxococcus stipitatus DSM 14675]|uniref:Glucose 1-dehydrogenase n=1 Tax=Myxococcus stipitatus (strain DSM 14675 / JCM 12634 / Mx s8) TaxID=1278073 RepID=L7U4G3_MYXSD|nr:glucose 1-dehydrogenase [Myxococcus stipitatus]AGC41404.1 glucose 1-dehydrogenase [Myxococcus stipitatus DSM 14675]